MKKLRLLRGILSRTHADKLLVSYVAFVLLCALVIWLVEPFVEHYGDALWYCYAVISTVGFGDVLVTTAIAKTLSVLLTVYTTLIVAIVTGVVVNFYNQIIRLREKDSLAGLLDTLEQLPELSRDELQAIADKVRKRNS